MDTDATDTGARRATAAAPRRTMTAALAAAVLALAARPGAAAPGGTAGWTEAAPAPAVLADTVRSTALVGGAAAAQVRPGQTVTVPIVLDLSAAGASGDLGAAQLELAFPADVLQFVSAQPGVSGAVQSNVASPGRLRVAFAGTQPQGRPVLTLVTATFRVAPGAAAGAGGELRLTYPTRPVTTGFRRIAPPAVSGSTVRVVR